MPKMKTKSGAKKRFKITGTGKVKRKHAYKSHILTKKEHDQKKRLGKFTLVDKTEVKNIKRLLAI
jgi:large subunit ribosomal protein L35